MLLADALQPQRLVVLELDVVGRIIIFQVEFGLELALLLGFRLSLLARLFFALLRLLALLPPLLVPRRVVQVVFAVDIAGLASADAFVALSRRGGARGRRFGAALRLCRWRRRRGVRCGQAVERSPI